MANRKQLQASFDEALNDHIRKLCNVLMTDSAASDKQRQAAIGRFKIGLNNAIVIHDMLTAMASEVATS